MNARAAVSLWAAASLGCAASADAAEVLATEVTHIEDRYAVNFDVRLAAPPERLKRYLTDYANYASYFDSIRESRVLGRTRDGALRVHLRLYSCVLFFCRSATVVKDVTERPDGTITARIEPDLSDFREATEHWRIVPDRGQTRLLYQAQLVPKFYVPPLVGPWLLKRHIRRTLEYSAVKLETLANEKPQ